MKQVQNLVMVVMALGLLFQGSSEHNVTGTVVSAVGGKTIANASISVKGSAMGTKSSRDGSFELKGIDPYGTLVISHVKYQTREINVKGRKKLTVELQPLVEIEELQDAERSTSAPVQDRVISKRQFGNVNSQGGHAIMQAPADATYHNTEEYDVIRENTFHRASHSPLSTFSIDVDGASYSNVRRVINNGSMPHKDMVRIEEMVNYFDYDYPQPKDEHPFSITTEVGRTPWNADHRLVHIGLQGKELAIDELKPNNLVFLVDVSGSMGAPNKLPLLKSSMKMLVDKLDERDRVAIVVYAGAAGLVLPSTPVSQKQTILNALDRLQSGGSTAGGAGIKLAYKVALDNLMEEGNNRVILATDGDFNVGASSTAEMVRLIEDRRDQDIFLTITGFGMGNYKDGRMEQISNAGNGNYYYIDNIREAEKVFVHQLRSTLFTIAKDVKIQVEFNPSVVQAYRLIGYENRMLEDRDFNDDKKDAGELGAGHTVTALYEIIPVGVKSDFVGDVDDLKYSQKPKTSYTGTDELLTVKLRYKEPNGSKSKLIKQPLANVDESQRGASENFRFSAAVAMYGMVLRDSEFKKHSSIDDAIKLANGSRGEDRYGYRDEFIRMMQTSVLLANKQ